MNPNAYAPAFLAPIVAFLLAAASAARAGEGPVPSAVEGRPTLAVIGFGVEPGDDRGARAAEILCALLEGALSADGALELVERRRIDDILGELSLSRSAVVSREDALRVGRLARADLLAYGKIGVRDGARFVEARLVEAATSRIRHIYSRSIPAGSEPSAAEELARVFSYAARTDRPGPRLAILPFRQTRGFDRLVFLQMGLRRLLVRDFQALGAFFVLEREDMDALTDEIDLARSALTPGGAGPARQREAWYILSGEFEELTIEGEPGLRLKVRLAAAGSGSERALTLERPASALDEIRRAIVNWVAKRASARRPYRFSDRETEFNRLLRRAVGLMSRMEAVQLHGIPGIELPRYRSHRDRPVQLTSTDGRAYDALVESATNALECAIFIRPEDHRPRMLLSVCLTRHQSWMCERERMPEARARADRAAALLEEVIRQDPAGPNGAAARRLLPGVYDFGRGHAGYSDEGEKRLPYVKKYLAALVSCYEDTPPELRTPGDVGALRTAALRHLSYSRLLGPGALEATMRHIRVAVTDRSMTRPHRPQPYVEDLIRAARKLDRMDDAIEFLKGLPLDEPKTAFPIIYNLGVAYREKGDLQECVRHFERALKVCETDWRYFSSRYYRTVLDVGKAHMAAEEEDEALECFEKIARDYLVAKGGAGNDLKKLCDELEPLYAERGRLGEMLPIYEAAYKRSIWLRREKWLLERLAEARKRAEMGKPVRARRRLVVEPYPLPDSRCADVDEIRFDGPFAWVVCYGPGGRYYGGAYGRSSCVYRVDIRTREVAKLAGPDLPGPGRQPTSLAVTPRCLWVGTFGNGLWRLDRAAGTWKQYSEESGLPFNYVTALDRRDGRLYVGFGRGKRGGIARMDSPGRFELLGGRRVESAPEVSGWIPGATGRLATVRAERPGSWVRRIRAISGGVLARVSRGEGLVLFDEKRGLWKRIRSRYTNLQLDAHSDLIWHYTSSSGGASFTFFEPLRGGRWKEVGSFNEETEERVHMTVPASATRYAGRIWFVGRNIGKLHSSGLYSFDSGSGELTAYGPQDGLEFDYASVVVLREDSLWAGANKGLYRIRPLPGGAVEDARRVQRRRPDPEAVSKDEPAVRDEKKFRAALEALVEMVSLPGADRLPERERAAAVTRAAGRLDEAKAVPHLITVLSEGPDELQEPACQALARLWKHSLSELVKAHRELKYPASRLPLRVIESITDPQAAPDVVRLAAEAGSDYVLRAVKAAIRKMGPRAVEALEPLLDEDIRSIGTLAELFAEMGSPAIPLLVRRLSSRRSKYWPEEALIKLAPECVGHLVPLLSGERRVAYRAATVLRRIGAPALPALIECMRTGTDQARAFATSTLRRIEEAEEPLVSLLSHPEPKVRRSAAAALTNAKSPSAVDALIRATGDPVANVRSWAAGTLGDLKAEQAIDPLVGLLGDGSENVRNRAASALAEIGEKALDVLLEEMRSPEEDRRARAVYYLGLADWAPLEKIAKALDDPSPRVRRAAASAAGRARDPWALPFLKKAAGDTDERAAMSAVMSLARYFPEEVGALREVLTDPRDKIRKIAAAYCFEAPYSSLKPAAPLGLIEVALKDESAEVRRLAAKSLARHKDREALRVVLKALSDPDRGVRERAVRSRLLTAPEARPTLLGCLRQDRGAVRARAAGLLANSPSTSELDMFVELLQSAPEVGVRMNAAEALGKLGGPKAAEALIKALRDKDDGVRRKAAKALEKIGDEAALEALREAVKKERDGRTKLRMDRTIKALEAVKAGEGGRR